MRSSCRSHHRILSVLALLLAAVQLYAQPKPAPKPSAIRLNVDQIAAPPASLRVFKLTAQKPPTAFIEEALPGVAPESKKLTPLSQVPQLAEKIGKLPPQLVGAFSEGHLAAYVDLRTGDAELFPSFARQKPVPVAEEGRGLERAADLARKIFSRPDVLEKDATQVSFDKPRSLQGEQAEQAPGGTKASARQVFLTYVPVRRSVDQHYVYGPGSRALLVVGNDGSVQGFVRRWKVAAAGGEVKETRSREQIAEAIRAQLAPAARSGQVEVLGTEIAYYDGHRGYLQPVYRFTAKVRHALPGATAGDKAASADDDFVVGYIPIGKAVEPVPSLTAPRTGPVAPPQKRPPTVAPKPGDPTVGRYVVRDDDPNWVASANEFWSGLTAFFGGGLFTNSQYFWAHPFEFTTSEAAFVNSVNVALNEVHGNWWFFTTEKNCCDGVNIDTIPAAQAYGPANGGHLSYWILHSCEVVPSAADAPCPTDNRAWWHPWFTMFKGMHTVVGYRTIMWIDDDVTGPYGFSLRLGASVVSAWFNATTSAAGYLGNPTALAHCGNSPPMGRPSTVSVCGRQNDWIYDTSALPAASCLINFWQPN